MDQLSLKESQVYLRAAEEDFRITFKDEMVVKVYAFNHRAMVVSLMLDAPTLMIELVDNIQLADCVFAVEPVDRMDELDTLIAEFDMPYISVKLPSPDILLAWETATTKVSYEERERDRKITGIQTVIKQLLPFIDNNHHREGLADTPHRVAKAWAKWTEGYHMDAASILKVFEDGAEKCDEMVIVKDIPIYSKCEHHLADIFGTATIAYIPNGKIVGLSKLSRLAEMFSRRLQVQERLTNQIADSLEEHLGAKGVGVVIRARHMCMESRGICQQGHHTITSALRGVMKDNLEARAEFMSLANTQVKV